MIRICVLALVLLGVTACDGAKKERKKPGSGGGAVSGKERPPESPTTGISQIQKLHDELKEEIAVQEKRVEAGEPAEQRLVRGQLTGIDILINNTKMAIANDTRQTMRREHALLRQKESRIIKKRDETYAEVQEMRTMLQNKKDGVAELPAGFTEAEIQDRLQDFSDAASKLDADWKEVRAQMAKKEELLKLDVIPPQGETLFTRELEELQRTRKRVEALLKEG